MAKTTKAEPGPRTQTYEFVAEYAEYDKRGKPVGDPRTLWVDNLAGERVPVEPGTRFTAELVPETVVDRRGVTPVEVPTGGFRVASSDADIHPGCLDSCVRTGRARPVN